LININYDETIEKNHITLSKENNFSYEHEIDVFYGKELLPTREVVVNLLLVLLAVYLILFSYFDLSKAGEKISYEKIKQDLEIIRNESNI
jgi:hypothetical protein